MFPLTFSCLLSRLALTISTPSPSKVATPGDLTISERWRQFQKRSAESPKWMVWSLLTVPAIIPGRGLQIHPRLWERMLVNVAVDMVARCHISKTGLLPFRFVVEITALRLHSSWWCRGTYSGDASESLSSANFCRARDSSGQLWAPRATVKVRDSLGLRCKELDTTTCNLLVGWSFEEMHLQFFPSLEKVPGRTSSKSVLRQAAAPWSQETRRPCGILSGRAKDRWEECL